jgi:hypothetical protein
MSIEKLIFVECAPFNPNTEQNHRVSLPTFMIVGANGWQDHIITESNTAQTSPVWAQWLKPHQRISNDNHAEVGRAIKLRFRNRGVLA